MSQTRQFTAGDQGLRFGWCLISWQVRMMFDFLTKFDNVWFLDNSLLANMMFFCQNLIMFDFLTSKNDVHFETECTNKWVINICHMVFTYPFCRRPWIGRSWCCCKRTPHRPATLRRVCSRLHAWTNVRWHILHVIRARFTATCMRHLLVHAAFVPCILAS